MNPNSFAAYDLYIVEHGSDRDARRGFGWQGEDLSLLEAEDACRELRRHGGFALIAPSVYRGASVSREQAKVAALRHYNWLRAKGRRLSELSEAQDEVVWWIFEADDFEAQEKGFTPGTCRIAVDKCQGYVVSDEEVAAFYALWRGVSGS